MPQTSHELIEKIKEQLVYIISETNGISTSDTLELLSLSPQLKSLPHIKKLVDEFIELLSAFHRDKVDIYTLLNHPVSLAFSQFFKSFPLSFHEEHIHLTGSLSSEFIYPYLKKLLSGPKKNIYRKKIQEVYKKDPMEIKGPEDLESFIRLKEGEQFGTYLKILFLPKLILTSKAVHEDAAFHMAQDLYNKYNVGNIRLKFTLSRASSMEAEEIPGVGKITEDDVVVGLYNGFKKFQKKVPSFQFILSPCFRKEPDFYDKDNYETKKDHFLEQVDTILSLIDKYPFLKGHLCEVDTVGDEKGLYRKKHFEEMRAGLRKLQYRGFKIRSHHGETWKSLRLGVQAVDNAMNIWHIDTLEHGLSLGINPNYYFHRIFQKIMEINEQEKPIPKFDPTYSEIMDMKWHDQETKDKLIKGKKLNEFERTSFLKTKFFAARELEHYQHDVLNRMIDKKVSLVALPSSNWKLTGSVSDYKDHPFSWWEKKGVQLGVGTDNYITLNTNYIQEMLILLYSDPENLKITKLLMICTKEKRRPYISALLWNMRKEVIEYRDKNQ